MVWQCSAAAETGCTVNEEQLVEKHLEQTDLIDTMAEEDSCVTGVQVFGSHYAALCRQTL